ncbi:hypothetical protein [Longimicrobium sp.]|uniref:T4 family baseplate hub assembly chaperone n=1 Tax=Longimicrobium sp. TaxID=2029185 RepID=UPI002C085398|nr:hypothetical protein [Longimicrobium sp.]HSU13650.1 hypothetical protein [Longimicrobium sp.]
MPETTLRTPAADELLALWERWDGEPPAWRGLALAAAASARPEAAGGLTVGQRDAVLLSLRERLFGPRVVSTAACPACGERLELDFEVDDVRMDASPSAGPIALAVDGFELAVRLPTSADAADAARARGVDGARRLLLERCVVDAREGGEARAPGDLPDPVVRAVAAEMVEADPQAEVRLSLTCPACGHGWEALFDIVSFLWSEIEAWGERTLREVHSLARAYGWREGDVLALTPARRRRYLEMVGE